MQQPGVRQGEAQVLGHSSREGVKQDKNPQNHTEPREDTKPNIYTKYYSFQNPQGQPRLTSLHMFSPQRKQYRDSHGTQQLSLSLAARCGLTEPPLGPGFVGWGLRVRESKAPTPEGLRGSPVLLLGQSIHNRSLPDSRNN